MSRNNMQLAEFLKDFVPKGHSYDVLHLESNPRETHSLVTPKHSNDIKTIKVQHFITLSHNELIIFALEIFVYITVNQRDSETESLLFVSKADTNGLNDTKLKFHLVTSQIIKYLLQLPIENYLQNIIPKKLTPIDTKNSITRETSTQNALRILINRSNGSEIPEQIQPYSITISQDNKHITKVALFTRPEPQYLFPDSGKNENKHILSGDQLLKWWLRVLDSVLLDSFEIDSSSAKVRIPAEETSNIARHLTPLKFKNWGVGDIFSGEDEKELAVYHIPLFPDDPKTRFLEHLVVEGRIKNVSLQQFWNELQIRQEFRLGVTVSVIGIEGHLKKNSQDRFEHGLLLSHKQFKNVKTYVTGEDYSTQTGALESYANVTDYLHHHFSYRIPEFTGAYAPELKVAPDKRPVEVHSLNAMLVRKRPKK